MIRFLAALALTLGSPAAAASSPWQDIASGDIERLHQSVVDFHPGMRDRDTPDFAKRVEAAYRTAKVRAQGRRRAAPRRARTAVDRTDA